MSGPRASWTPIGCSGVKRGVWTDRGGVSRRPGGARLEPSPGAGRSTSKRTGRPGVPQSAAAAAAGSGVLRRSPPARGRAPAPPPRAGGAGGAAAAGVERGSAPSVPEAPGQAARDHGRGGVERQVTDDVGEEDPGELLTEEEGDAGPDPGQLAAGYRRDGEADGPLLGDGPPAAGEG